MNLEWHMAIKNIQIKTKPKPQTKTALNKKGKQAFPAGNSPFHRFFSICLEDMNER